MLEFPTLNFLSFFAHPDDETMLAGGTLALLAANGGQVHYLSATRGEGGEMGDPPLCSRAELGEVRERELHCAVQTLNGKSLSFLGYTDPLVGPEDALFPYTEDMETLAQQLVAHIHRLKIGGVITHGSNGEYGHPAHKITHQAARRALELLGADAPSLYSVAAMFPEHPRPRLANADDPADLVIDIVPVLAQKTAAALCHRTQHDLFVRRASEQAGRRLSVPEVIMPVESLHRVYSNPADRLPTLLEPYTL